MLWVLFDLNSQETQAHIMVKIFVRPKKLRNTNNSNGLNELFIQKQRNLKHYKGWVIY